MTNIISEMWKKTTIARKIWMSISILCIGYFITVAYGFIIGHMTENRINRVSRCLLPASGKSQEAMTAFEKQFKLYKDFIMVGENKYLEEAGELSLDAQKFLQEIIELEGFSEIERIQDIIDQEEISESDHDNTDVEGKEKNKKRKIDEIKKIIEQLKKYTVSAHSFYTTMSGDAAETEEEDEKDAIQEAATKLNKEKNELQSSLNKLTTFFAKGLKIELSSISDDTSRQNWMNIICFFAVVIIASWAAAIIIRRSVINPLNMSVDMIENIAEGDLTKHDTVDMEDEIGKLITALNTMGDSLKSIVKAVTDTTMNADKSASEISVAVDEQASIAAEQSASVSEITSTMEELSASSTQVAGHANSVAEIAGSALHNTKEGAEAVEIVMSMINEINEANKTNIEEIVELGRKSEEINKVMEIINNVADQTKLIAFNAALEASSAGEAGKRFGVVAVEIRRLADSVMESTSETESKIKEIQKAVNSMVISSEKGSKVIQDSLEYSTQTASKLSDIVDGAQATADAAKQISLSTQQAKTASEQVVTALKEIVQGAKQTTDAIKQIGGISKDLTVIAGNLKNQIKTFKVDDND